MNLGGSSISSIASTRFPNYYSNFHFSTKSLISHSKIFAYSSKSTTTTSKPAASITSSSTTSSSSEQPLEVAVPVQVKKLPLKQHPWLIVGLGNPGKMYNGTRHNVGFMMVDYLAEAEGISMSNVSFKALFGKGLIGNVPVLLAKPQTFMNLSGASVGAIASYYKIPLQQVLVIFDDMDLPFAKLRLLPKGGHGGHNGMRSIIDHFKGSRDFPRLRIGIDRPPGKMEAVKYVLRPFNKQESQELDFTFQTGVEAVRILLLEGFNKSATFVNTAKSLEKLR